MESKEGSYFSLSIFSGEVVEVNDLIFTILLRLTFLLPMSEENNRDKNLSVLKYLKQSRKGKRTYVREDKIHYLFSYFLS